MTMSIGQALLAILEGDIADSVGTPLGTLGAALKAANGDPIKDFVAWQQFRGNLAPALVQFEVEAQGQLISFFQSKENTLIGQIQAKAAAAQAQLAPKAP